MELGFIENLRRRWDVLGIHLKRAAEDDGGGGTDQTVLEQEAQAVLDEDEDKDEDAAEDRRIAAQRQILSGGIVQNALVRAVAGEWLSFRVPVD